jgi:hypothetical protein
MNNLTPPLEKRKIKFLFTFYIFVISIIISFSCDKVVKKTQPPRQGHTPCPGGYLGLKQHHLWAVESPLLGPLKQRILLASLKYFFGTHIGIAVGPQQLYYLGLAKAWL